MQPKDRVRFVQIVAQMLIIDGVLHDDERAHLDRIMDALDLTEEERDQALSEVSLESPVEERIGELGSEARAQLLASVERALESDGQVSPAEAAFMARIRAVLD